MKRCALILLAAAGLLRAAEPSAQPPARPAAQNPSPMVEHTRAHLRLEERRPPGKRETLAMGQLFLPEKLPADATDLLIHFHGGTWIPEVAAEKTLCAVIAVQLGSGSSTYAKPFAEEGTFRELLVEAETKAGRKFDSITLSGWSAGYGAIRAILKVPANYERVQKVLLLDGLHCSYADGKPGPKESSLVADDLQIFVQLARDAAMGKRQFLLTHTEIFPGTFASTTETADYLLKELGLKRRPVLRWGPMGTQILGEATQGRFHLLSFAGNSAPDHVDLLHSLPDLLNESPLKASD